MAHKFLNVLFIFSCTVLAYNAVLACQSKGEGCAAHIPCCSGSKCDVTSGIWGFCQSGHHSDGQSGGKPGGKPAQQPSRQQPRTSPPGRALITKDEFIRAVTINGYPSPTDEQYRNIIRRAGPAGKITTKQELAMFLANILHESDGLRAKEEYNPQSYVHALDRPGKKYHGRGYMQLTWAYNYKAASEALYGDLRLLNTPEQVASNDIIAWDTAFWFWSANVHNKPGISQGHFGVSTKAINGGHECGGSNTTGARRRFAMYQKIFNVFGLSGQPIATGCY